MQRDQQRQAFAIHPYKIFVFLVIAAITVLFLSLTISYGYTRFQKGMEAIPLPWIFFINSFLLIGSSISLIRARSSYNRDKARRFQVLLLVAIVLSLSFLISQIFGWIHLFNNQLPLGVHNGVSYLYLISGVHFAHVLIGLPFLISYYLKARIEMREPVGELLYFTDSEKKLRLNLLNIYWHFLDALWIYLVVFFAVNAIM